MTSLQFFLRQRFIGRIKLRPGLPKPPETQAILAERAFYKLVLNRAFGAEQAPEFLDVLDIGCRNWSYAKALSGFFPNAGLTGIEIDGGRRYWNLHRRMDLALAYARELGQNSTRARCIFKDFLELNLQATGPVAFCFFFPFVSEHPCVHWGLPKRYADFTAVLGHARKLSSGSSTVFVSLHQGEWEAEIARVSYKGLGFKFTENVLTPEEFRGLWPSQHDLHIIVSRKEVPESLGGNPGTLEQA